MWGLMRSITKTFVSFVIVLAFVLFSSGLLSTVLVNQADSQTGCGASCHTISHTLGVTSGIRESYRKKKLVVTTWLQAAADIRFTYILPLAVFVWFTDRYRRLLLTARFRF